MSEIIYGIHALQAILERDPQRFLDVYLLKGREDRRFQPLVRQLEQA
ncbi:23S rRNA methyltransferase, partial [Sodalis-like endosymbiont of Proechinophthirus fluctus]